MCLLSFDTTVTLKVIIEKKQVLQAYEGQEGAKVFQHLSGHKRSKAWGHV